MEEKRPALSFHTSLLVAGYAVGLAGWVLHWAYDLGVFGFESGGIPVHVLSEIVMEFGSVLALVALTPPLRKRVGRALTYGWLVVEVLIAFLQPVVGGIILLGMPLAALQLLRPSSRFGLRIAVATLPEPSCLRQRRRLTLTGGASWLH